LVFKKSNVKYLKMEGVSSYCKSFLKLCDFQKKNCRLQREMSIRGPEITFSSLSKSSAGIQQSHPLQQARLFNSCHSFLPPLAVEEHTGKESFQPCLLVGFDRRYDQSIKDNGWDTKHYFIFLSRYYSSRFVLSSQFLCVRP
jgi:hypothetical protein